MPRPSSLTVHGAVGVERHVDMVGMAGERLVDGVVDDLVDHVVQAGAVVGVADIHAGTLAHGVEATQHLDGPCAIFRGVVPFGFFVHVTYSSGGRTTLDSRRPILPRNGCKMHGNNCAFGRLHRLSGGRRARAGFPARVMPGRRAES